MTIAIKDTMSNVVYLGIKSQPMGDETDAAQYVIAAILSHTDATLIEIARTEEK